MGWYRIVKTIKGHRYIYEQRTWREGKHVRTESRYLGPADDSTPLGPIGERSSRERERTTDRTPTQAAGVNTTPAFTPVLVEETFDALTAALPNSQTWIKPWRTRRKGPNLVQNNAAVDAVVARLSPQFTETPGRAYYAHGRDFINIPPEQHFFDQ